MKSAEMLSDALIEEILSRLPQLKIGVLGDLFLDRYLDLDANLTEPSIETGLDAYQVIRVRSYPGAAGTVINNLVALGVGRVVLVSLIGEDGEGFELRQALGQLRAVDASLILSTADRRTPTYTKPMLCEQGISRELNRLDIKNRTPTPLAAAEEISRLLEDAWNEVDAWIVLDQVSEEDCGVVTKKVRERLMGMAQSDSDKFVLADSRERIDQFHDVAAKPNEAELRRAFDKHERSERPLEDLICPFARSLGRPVFCTRGASGTWLGEPGNDEATHVPAYPVQGPIDIVGAGDSTSAGITCARTSGVSLPQAAAFGNLVASITIQQLGVTGTASPEQVRQRWREIQLRGG